jgi:hypothetical protein
MRSMKPRLLLAGSLLLAAPAALALKVETAALLIGTTVLGAEAGVAALRGQPSWFSQLRAASAAEGWLLAIESEGPRGDFASLRDIRVTTLDLSRAWRLPHGFEFQLGGGVASAQGSKSDLFSPEPPRDSDAIALHLGPGLRYNLPEWRGSRVFIDSSVHLLVSSPEFPTDGTRVNGLIRHGIGLGHDFGRYGRAEAGWHLGHISNGSGENDNNPAWDGQGAWLGWRFEL